MTLFLSITAVLAILTAAALLAPLVSRRLKQPAQRGLAAALLVALPVAALGLYFQLGTPEALDQARGDGPPDLAQAADRLADRLANDPDNLEGWLLLGRSRMAMERPAAAAEAFREALRLMPDNPTIMVELAEAVSHVQDFRLAGEPAALLDEAILRDSTHQRALWFGGLADLQAGNYQRAERRWEILLRHLDPDSQVAQSVRQQLERIDAMADGGSDPREAARPPPAADTADANIRLRVSLDERFDADVSANQVVYVFARPAGGGGMPLAVRRMRVGDLPASVILGPDDAMTRAQSLAGAGEVEVVVRVSRDGTPTAGAGDLEGRAGPLEVGVQTPVEVVIDRRIGADDAS